MPDWLGLWPFLLPPVLLNRSCELFEALGENRLLAWPGRTLLPVVCNPVLGDWNLFRFTLPP